MSLTWENSSGKRTVRIDDGDLNGVNAIRLLSASLVNRWPPLPKAEHDCASRQLPLKKGMVITWNDLIQANTTLFASMGRAVDESASPDASLVALHMACAESVSCS